MGSWSFTQVSCSSSQMGTLSSLHSWCTSLGHFHSRCLMLLPNLSRILTCCRIKIRVDGDFLGQSGHFLPTGKGRWAADLLWYRTYFQSTKYLASFWSQC